MRRVDLQGRNVLVTGGARRVGRAIALRLAAEGLQVAVTYRTSRREALKTEKELRACGVRACALRADLGSLPDCHRLIERVERRLGPVDVLINNASAFPATPLRELSEDVGKFRTLFHQLANLHMRAPLFLGMRLGWKMKARGWGRIINLTDHTTVRSQAYRHHALYLITKYGLHGVTQVLAAELAPQVTVNSVAPGLVVAPEHYSRRQVAALTQRVPLRRSAGTEEIAADVLFLIRSGFKTGSVVLSDGGISTQSPGSA